MSQLQPQREFTGIWIPAVIINDPELTPTDLIVYAQIASFNCCTASNQYLAELAHVSVRSVQYTIKRLEAKGYIRIEDTRSKAGIVKRKIFAMGVENYEKQMQDGMQNLHGGVQNLHGGYAKSARNNKEDNKDNILVLDKSNTNKQSSEIQPVEKSEYGNSEINSFIKSFEETLGLPIATKQKLNRYAAKRLLARYKPEGCAKLITLASMANTTPYAPRIANVMDLEQKVPNLFVWYRQNANKGQNRAVKAVDDEFADCEVVEDF